MNGDVGDVACGILNLEVAKELVCVFGMQGKLNYLVISYFCFSSKTCNVVLVDDNLSNGKRLIKKKRKAKIKKKWKERNRRILTA